MFVKKKKLKKEDKKTKKNKLTKKPSTIFLITLFV